MIPDPELIYLIALMIPHDTWSRIISVSEPWWALQWGQSPSLEWPGPISVVQGRCRLLYKQFSLILKATAPPRPLREIGSGRPCRTIASSPPSKIFKFIIYLTFMQELCMYSYIIIQLYIVCYNYIGNITTAYPCA